MLAMDGIIASTFRYPGGVAALRLRAPRAEVIVLPFMGQQIWRASFDGHDATMLSMFDEPVATDRFLETYGAFFIHCGITGVGAPGPDDSHPLHGELPLAPYDDVWLEADPGAGRITVSGRYRHRVAFSTNYTATASVTLTVDEAAADIGMAVENRRDADMDLLYLGHANFRPVDGSELVYSAHYTPRDVAVRRSVPSHITPPPGYLKGIERLAADPALHHAIGADDLTCDPELVFNLVMQPDASGRAHALQRHPGGSADVISYDVASLPMAIRWLCRTGDQQGLGLALPSTSGGGRLHSGKGGWPRGEPWPP